MQNIKGPLATIEQAAAGGEHQYGVGKAGTFGFGEHSFERFATDRGETKDPTMVETSDEAHGAMADSAMSIEEDTRVLCSGCSHTCILTAFPEAELQAVRKRAMAGRFITFEGLDGSGKSTHLRHAEEWLKDAGHEVLVTHEPGGTPMGDAIRGIFLDTRWDHVDPRVEAMLVFASRRQHLVELVEPNLESGIDVLCDRFTDSTLAYQGTGRGLSRQWIDDLDRLATSRRRPDLTLLFDLPAEMAHRRGQSPKRRERGDVDRIDTESLAFYQRVRTSYLELAESEPERFVVIDSGGAKEDTWQQVVEVLERVFSVVEAEAPR